MKTRWSASILIGSMAALAAWPALAEHGEGSPHHRFIRPEGGPPPAFDQRWEERRRMREFRRQQRDAGQEAPYRLSPEERRQLREDIRSAREGLYRRPPRGHAAPAYPAPPEAPRFDPPPP